MKDISKNLNTALDIINAKFRDTDVTIDALLSSKQDVIDSDNKLDYSLISGTPSIPLSTSELINNSDFQTSADVENALESKIGSPIVDVEEKNTSGAFTVDFTGAPIQKYDIPSCPNGTVTFDYANLSGVADNQASTIEVQLPVKGR